MRRCNKPIFVYVPCNIYQAFLSCVKNLITKFVAKSFVAIKLCTSLTYAELYATSLKSFSSTILENESWSVIVSARQSILLYNIFALTDRVIVSIIAFKILFSLPSEDAPLCTHTNIHGSTLVRTLV